MIRRRYIYHRLTLIWALVACFLLAFAACQSHQNYGDYELEEMQEGEAVAEADKGYSDGGMEDSPLVVETAKKTTSYNSADSNTAETIPRTNVQTSRKLIKIADLVYEVKSLDSFNSELQQWIAAFDAYISKDNLTVDSYRTTRTVELRMPVQNFDPMVEAIGKKVGHFDRRKIDVKDVTMTYVDTEAELKSAKTLENRILALLEHAADLEQVLRLEREIARQRKVVETIESRLKYLQRSTQLSTISIKVYVITPQPVKSDLPKTYIKPSFGKKFVEAFTEGWEDVKDVTLQLTENWPLLMLLIVIIISIIYSLKNLSRRQVETPKEITHHVQHNSGTETQDESGESNAESPKKEEKASEDNAEPSKKEEKVSEDNDDKT